VAAEKIENWLATWKCGQLSYGGKAVLLNSSLTSIPMYLMGFYLLYEGNHQRMDTARACFFWQEIGKKKKYHMMRWEALSVPKDFGGLGFLETRAMNMALLAKWLFRIESGDSSMCINLLRTKYLGNCGVFQEKVKSCSFFWSGLRKVRD